MTKPKDDAERIEADRILNFLAACVIGVCSAERPIVRRIMLDTSGEMLAQGRMWAIVAKPLGGGVYQVRLTPSPRESRKGRRT